MVQNASKGYFERLAPTICDNGYGVVPVVPESKKPAVRAWQNHRIRAASEHRLAGWIRDFPNHSVGLVCGPVIGIDIDVVDRDAVQKIVCAAALCIGEPTPLQRIGRAPKLLLVYRASGEIASQDCKLSVGTVQILSTGRQFVAYGIHPETKEPYHWHMGSSEPFDTPLDRLPAVATQDIEAFIRTITILFPALTTVGQVRSIAHVTRDPHTGRVIDGREAFLAHLIWQHYSNAVVKDATSIAKAAWWDFERQADLTRPHKGARRWLFKDALNKAQATVRNRARKGGEVVRRARLKCPPTTALSISDVERTAFSDLIVSQIGRRKLTPSAVQVSTFMLSRLKDGHCVDTVGFIASKTGLAERTVQYARRALLEAGFWKTARQRGRDHVAPFWPSPSMVAQALEIPSVSSRGVQRFAPNPTAMGGYSGSDCGSARPPVTLQWNLTVPEVMPANAAASPDLSVEVEDNRNTRLLFSPSNANASSPNDRQSHPAPRAKAKGRGGS